MEQGKPRIVERYQNGSWKRVRWEDLNKGDMIRIFEPTGEPVKLPDGSEVMILESEHKIKPGDKITVSVPEKERGEDQ